MSSVKSTESPCSGRHPHYPHALPPDAGNIAFLFKFIYWGMVYSVQYLNHKVEIRVYSPQFLVYPFTQNSIVVIYVTLFIYWQKLNAHGSKTCF